MRNNKELIKRILISFVEDPNKSWGNPTSDETRWHVQVNVEQADRNTARLISGTYTPEQYADFQQQLCQVERNEIKTAYFIGDPNILPENVPKRICSHCGKTFKSASTDENVKCYDCNLDQLRLELPGRHFKAWWERDEWSMQAFGDTGHSNKMTFWWYNDNSSGNVCHQGLVVRRTAKGNIQSLRFSSVAYNAGRCYIIIFNLEEGSAVFYVCDTINVNDDSWKLWHGVDEFDPVIFDLIIAMLPAWMLYEHRPRNPENGCFVC